MSQSPIHKGIGIGDAALIKYALLKNWANFGIICRNMLEIVIKDACFLSDDMIKYAQ